MGIDKITQPNSIWVTFPKKMVKTLYDKANSEGINDEEEVDDCLITDDLGSFEVSEYYFDESEGSINYSGEIITEKGKVYVSFDVPLSDTVLIDIMEHTVKKLNKLKSVMESLK